MSTLGKNLVTLPDVQNQAKDGCGKAGDAVDNAVDKAGETVSNIGNGFRNTFGLRAKRAPASAGSALEGVCNKGAEAANKAVQLTADAINKAGGSIAHAIGIAEYYSVHIGVLCAGDYTPDFAAPDARPDIAACSPKFAAGQTDLAKKLDDEMQVGPFKFRLSDLDLVEGIQTAFDLIPRALVAMSYFFLVAAVALVAGFLTALAVLVLGLGFRPQLHGVQQMALLGGVGAVGLGWFLSLVGVVGLTVVAEKVKRAVNKDGGRFGMSAATSPAMYFLLWASLVCSTATLAALVFVWLRGRSADGSAVDEAYADKTLRRSGTSMEDSHGFYQEPVGGG
ncbi:hypothetical protein BT67DRAFT_348194, partial [Trichocladium antarcticum]